MPTITGLIPDRRGGGRFEVLVDGRVFAVLSLEAVERLGMHVGIALTDEAAEAVRREAAILTTYGRALTMLAVRARSVQELRRRLTQKGGSADSVSAAIARLEATGLLDDREFARQFTRVKITGPGFSRRRVQAELARRGVARDVADSSIDEVFEDERVDESASVERVAAKKFRATSGLEPIVRRRRLYAFLARRGYNVDDVSRVVDALMRDITPSGRSASK